MQCTYMITHSICLFIIQNNKTKEGLAVQVIILQSMTMLLCYISKIILWKMTFEWTFLYQILELIVSLYHLSKICPSHISSKKFTFVVVNVSSVYWGLHVAHSLTTLNGPTIFWKCRNPILTHVYIQLCLAQIIIRISTQHFNLFDFHLFFPPILFTRVTTSSSVRKLK